MRKLIPLTDPLRFNAYNFQIKHSESGGELFFFGSHHSFSECESDPLFWTHQQERIYATIDKFKPEVLIVEYDTRLSPDHPEYAAMLEKVKTLTELDLSKWKHEGIHAAHYSLKKENIHVTSGEPTNLQEKEYLKEKGFSDLDVAFFLVFRQLQQWPKDQLSALDYFTSPLVHIKELYGLDTSITLNKLKDHAKEMTGYTFEKLIERKDFNFIWSPSHFSRGTKKTNIIASLSSKFRDVNLREVAVSEVTKGKKVMVIYGEGHAQSNRALLEDVLK